MLLLLALICVAHFFRLGDLTTRGEESRRGTVALEVLRTGDWLVPRQQGEYYFSRPPLQNWLIAGVAWLRGECDSRATRLPSLLATLLTTLLLYGYGRTFLTRLGAFTAAAAYPTMAQVLQMGGMAETDALFTFFVSGSLLTWHWGWSRGWPAGRMWMLAYALVALGTLTKGPQAPVYFATSVGAFLVLSGKTRHLFTRGHLLGLLTFAVIFGAWLVPYTQQMGLDGARRILGEQAACRYYVAGVWPMARHLLTYPLEVFGCLLPWSLVLIAYLRRSFWQNLGGAGENVRFLFTCLAVTFPTLWLAQGATGRYWMPLYPCWAPLIGLVVQRTAESAPNSPLRSGWTWFLTGFALVVASIPVLALAGEPLEAWTGWPLHQPSLLLVVGFSVAALALLVLLLRQRGHFAPARLQLAVFAMAGSMALCYSGWYMNILINRGIDTRGAVAQVKRELGGAPLVSFDELYHLFPYYYRDHIPRLNWPTSASDLPAGVTYFCFNAWPVKEDDPPYAPPQPLPFAWEPVALINCDRNYHPRADWIVVVARRLPDVQK
jgi:4-amino-4-deoxy-L-arabinose transferase-like glycosyltransferase